VGILLPAVPDRGLPDEALRPNSVKEQPSDIIVEERTELAEAA